MFYREVYPSAEFSNIVLSFWEFIVNDDAPAPVHHEIFPDGCVSLIYHRNEKFNVRNLLLNRLTLESIKLPVYAGDIFWGMRISPAAAAHIFKLNPVIFQAENSQTPALVAHLTDNLLEKLDECRNFAEAIEVFQHQLKRLDFGTGNCFDQKIADALNIIEANNTQIKISDLSRALNLSQRQLERRFKACSGLTPKQFVRARRIRATAISVVEDIARNWADRAAEIGFTDQSHLIHEVAAVTGHSPTSFAAKVRQIEHENILK